MSYLTPSLNSAPKPRRRSIWKILLGTLALLFGIAGALILTFFLVIRLQTEKTESFHPHVTVEQMQAVEERTGIHFPTGSEALCYFYNSVDCIDPSMKVKIKIPSDAVDDFKLKELKFAGPSVISRESRPWWKPHQLFGRSNGAFYAESAMVQWTLGTENGDHILYLHWWVM